MKRLAVRRLAVSAAGLMFLLAATTGASATGSISCQSEGNKAGIGLTIGSVAAPAVVGINLYVGDKLFSTNNPKAVPVALAQSFFETDRIMIDIADQNLEAIIARLRLFVAEDDNDRVTAGTLQVTDLGTFAVTCFGP
jgi:hypothetical protein